MGRLARVNARQLAWYGRVGPNPRCWRRLYRFAFAAFVTVNSRHVDARCNDAAVSRLCRRPVDEMWQFLTRRVVSVAGRARFAARVHGRQGSTGCTEAQSSGSFRPRGQRAPAPSPREPVPVRAAPAGDPVPGCGDGSRAPSRWALDRTCACRQLPADQAQAVRDNLRHWRARRKAETSGMAQHKRQRDELRERHATLLAEAAAVDAEVEQLVIGEHTATAERLREHTDEHRTRTAWREAALGKCGQSRRVLEHFVALLEDSYHPQRKLAAQVEAQRHNYSENGSGTPGLETACTQDVRHVVARLQQHLLETLKLGAGGDDGAGSKVSKVELCRDIDELHRAYSPTELSLAIATATEQAAAELALATRGINLRHDATRLKFAQSHRGDFEDVSDPASPLQSVEQLLENSRADHVSRHMDATRARNTEAGCKAELAAIAALVDQELTEKQSGLMAEETKAIQAVLQMEMQLAALEAGTSCLARETKRLRELALSRAANMKDLQRKARQIQLFRQVTESRQALIRLLIQGSALATSEQQELVAVMRQTTTTALEAASVRASICTEKLQGLAADEAERVDVLPQAQTLLSRLTDASGGGLLPVSHLAISSLGGSGRGEAKRAPLSSGAGAAEPAFVAPHVACDSVIPTIIELKGKARLHEKRSAALASVVEADDDAITFRSNGDLAARAEALRAEQQANMAPDLEASVHEIEQTVIEAARGHDLVEEWIEQPAQYLVPQLTRAGLTLEQWRQKLATAGTV